jgi:hypothetical protein
MVQQPRHRVVRFASISLLALALAALSVGCSQDAGGEQVATVRIETENVPASPGESRAEKPSGEHLIAAVIAAANQETYRFDWSVALAGIPSTPAFTLHGAGAVDPASQRYEMSMDLSSIFSMIFASGDLSREEQAELAALQGSGTMDFLLDGDTAYIRSPLIARELGAGTPWVSVSANDFPNAGMLGGFSQMVAPTDLPAMLQAVGDLKPNGNEIVRGTPTTRWDGTVDLLGLAQGRFAAAGADATDLQELLPTLEAVIPGISRIPVSMWVDGEHRMRRLEIKMSFPTPTPNALAPGASMTMRYELFDFGAATVMTPPAPGEVTDLGSALAVSPAR